jgi:hypothetical protein
LGEFFRQGFAKIEPGRLPFAGIFFDYHLLPLPPETDMSPYPCQAKATQGMQMISANPTPLEAYGRRLLPPRNLKKSEIPDLNEAQSNLRSHHSQIRLYFIPRNRPRHDAQGHKLDAYF